jgi:uncharacterized protein
MRILIDIGHPAHVHYFKNFIKIMKEKWHDILVTARDKDITLKLLEENSITYLNRGRGGNSLLKKIMYIPKADLFIYKAAKAFKPDLFVSFASTYAAHAATIYGKPHIAFDDTDHATLELLMYPPFTNTIITPISFKKDLGLKHIKFNGFIELCYLHHKYFSPDISIYKLLGIPENQKYIILRFVSWSATHDMSFKGLDIITKRKLVKELSKHVKVFISSEQELPTDLQPYKLKTPSNRVHDVLYYSSFLLGESGTMTSECAMLGTPAIQISGLPPNTIGTLGELEKVCNVKIMEKYSDSVVKIILDELQCKVKSKIEHQKFMAESYIDVTSFMVWFIENFPKSRDIVRSENNKLNDFYD